jgi:hypothetical protein
MRPFGFVKSKTGTNFTIKRSREKIMYTVKYMNNISSVLSRKD